MTTLLSKAALPFLIGGAMMLAAALLAWAALASVEAMVDQARANAIVERDAHWTAQIEKSNAAANQKIADQANATLQIQANASDSVAAAERELAERKKENEALPNGDGCGLSRSRVRLLPN